MKMSPPLSSCGEVQLGFSVVDGDVARETLIGLDPGASQAELVCSARDLEAAPLLQHNVFNADRPFTDEGAIAVRVFERA